MKRPFYNAIHSLFHNPQHIVYALLHRMPWLIPDDAKYLSTLYKLELGIKPDLDHPNKFSEKIQWLKLHDHNPLYTTLVDKLAVKEFVRERLGDEYVIPVIAEWDTPEQIEWTKLPNQFVIKTNHDGGGRGIVICKDKSKFSVAKAQKELNNSFNQSTYDRTREWPYKNVQKRVFAEAFVSDSNGELRDYKFFCFNGRPKYIQVDIDRFKCHRRSFFTDKWESAPFTTLYEQPEKMPEKPTQLEEMLGVATKLAKDYAFARIDLYIHENKVYFGEITLHPEGGCGIYIPDEYDFIMGDMLKLT